MTDRELLELAAKAAGKELLGWFWNDYVGAFIYAPEGSVPEAWSPLHDDGDALRMAVRLNLLDEHACFTYFLAEEMGASDDAYAATRRAIVRAASEIGRNK